MLGKNPVSNFRERDLLLDGDEEKESWEVIDQVWPNIRAVTTWSGPRAGAAGGTVRASAIRTVSQAPGALLDAGDIDLIRVA